MARPEPFVEPVYRRRFVGHARSGMGEAFSGMTWGAYAAFGAVAGVVFVTIFATHLAPYSATRPSGDPLLSPSHDHLFGTDEIGRDVFSRVLVGMQSSWWGAMSVVLSGLLFGGLIGLIAGTAGGIIDGILMRITDGFIALPGAVLAIAVSAALGPSYVHTLFAISIVWWPLYARIVRGEVTRLRAAPHYEAARLAGVTRARLSTRHLLPGAVPPTIIAATLDVGALLLTLAGLSFLGLGAPAPAPELGAMSARGLDYVFESWWVPIMPAFGVFLLAIVANVGGDALRDRLKDR